MKKNKTVYILLILITSLFLVVIKDYIVPVILAAIIAGLLGPTYQWFLKKLKGRKSLAAFLATILFLLIIVIPTIFLVVLIVNEAASISQNISPIIQGQVNNSSFLSDSLPDWFPFKDELEPFREKIYAKIGELAGMIGNLFMKGLSSLTQGTLVLFVDLFILLYALYYFFVESDTLNKKIYDLSPLTHQQTELLMHKTISISRATIKGALLVGIIQGSLVGLAFWAAGVKQPLFWGTLSAIMSLIPSIGTAIVYVPAGIYFILIGQSTTGIAILIWGFAVVSSVDNILRPQLVGKDTELPDLIVLISTLGGIGMFGISGLVLGPVIAGLMIAVLHIYRGDEYSELTEEIVNSED